MWIANHNNIDNPDYISGDWIKIPKEVVPPPAYKVTGDFDTA